MFTPSASVRAPGAPQQLQRIRGRALSGL